MKPGPLDLGYGRPLEFTLSVVVGTSPSPLDFQFAADTLVSQWPVLNLRMNPLKTKFLDPKDPGDLAEIWEGTTLKQELSEILQVSSAPDSPQLIDSEALDKALDFGKQQSSSTDDLVVGAHQIIQAYFRLLRGERITHTLHGRPPLSLKSEVVEKCIEKIECHQIADLHKHSMRRNWIAGIVALGKQIGRDICYPSARRVGKTMFIPRRQIQNWLKEAESIKAKVTEHDLLLAFIYSAALHPPTAHNFGLAIDISKQLKSEAKLYNPWYMMPIPDPIPSSVYNTPSLVRLAIHIRRAVREGQQPECIAEIVDRHKSLKGSPMVPKSYGSRAAQPRIASWKNLPLYDLDIQGKTPLFVQGSIDYCGLLREIKAQLDDFLVTWKARGQDGEDGGYWVHGRLPEAVWRRMADDLDC
ncbi:hypothetical protein PITC_031140 [Penicillium italicum]|uniref:Uncharacterized protein n=1 Tax=Penicillium italicum TaxID=40296 RepID=A0A0A2L6N9_PENIT|nr:hypothetical protein PITC_031140 [Penicillium italicum]